MLLATSGFSGCTGRNHPVDRAETVASIPGGLIPRETGQLLVVTADGWEATAGTLQRLERTGDRWSAVGDRVRVNLGTGLGWGRGLHPEPGSGSSLAPLKREGDGRSPAGLFRLGPVFSEVRLAGVSLPQELISDDRFCEDRADRPDYNRAVALSPGELEQCRAAGRCPEPLKRSDGQYRELLWVHHNPAPAVPGAGSCIFVHVEAGKDIPTIGCTAMEEARLLELLRWLDPLKAPLLLQLPLEAYSRYQAAWALPAIL